MNSSNLKDGVLAILFGAVFKLADEALDVPYFKTLDSNYTDMFKISTIFLWAFQASSDFYYSLVWVFITIFSYVGGSLDNFYWYVCGGLVFFSSIWTFSYPLPETHLPTLIGLCIFVSIASVVDNFSIFDSSLSIKLFETILFLIAIPVAYMLLIYPTQEKNPEWDLRFATKNFGWFFGYFLIRSISKFYLFVAE
jgi:hypothetical protein